MHAAAQQRVCSEVLDRGSDDIRSCDCSPWVFLAQEYERPFQVSQRACGIDYRRHGFGRSVTAPRASRSIQACTSSAR